MMIVKVGVKLLCMDKQLACLFYQSARHHPRHGNWKELVPSWAVGIHHGFLHVFKDWICHQNRTSMDIIYPSSWKDMIFGTIPCTHDLRLDRQGLLVPKKPFFRTMVIQTKRTQTADFTSRPPDVVPYTGNTVTTCYSPKKATPGNTLGCWDLSEPHFGLLSYSHLWLRKPGILLKPACPSKYFDLLTRSPLHGGWSYWIILIGTKSICVHTFFFLGQDKILVLLSGLLENPQFSR